MISQARNITPVIFYNNLIKQGVYANDAQFIVCVQYGLTPEELIKLQQNKRQEGGNNE